MFVAVFVDGGFVKSKWREAKRAYPTAEEVHTLCGESLMRSPLFAGDTLFRIFFYDCQPYLGDAFDPRTGTVVNYANTPSAEAQRRFLRDLSIRPHVALRSGELAYQGVKVPQDKLPMGGEVITLSSSDLIPDFRQKQIDIKMGLDIAWTAMKSIATKIVLVAGDSDLIPAMKFARKEGLLVYLCPLGHSVKLAMIEHCDNVLDVTP